MSVRIRIVGLNLDTHPDGEWMPEEASTNIDLNGLIQFYVEKHGPCSKLEIVLDNPSKDWSFFKY